MTADHQARLTPNGREDGFVRAVVAAANVPGQAPNDAVHLRIFHPAREPGDDSQRLTGVFPVDRSVGIGTDGRLPVVLLLNGINVGPEAYAWLATRIAAAGMACVTFSHVADLMPGHVGLTPGVDVTAVTPDTWGTRATCPTIAPILSALALLDASDGVLAGALDLDRVGLFGHSAGGTMVLQNARHDWHPTVRAGVTFGAHGMVSTLLGWDEGTVLPASDDAALLLIGGTADDVIARSADRYVTGEHALDPLTRTFRDAVPDRDGTNVLAWFDGHNHFLPVHPGDDTLARGFLERGVAADLESGRDALATLTISHFARHLSVSDVGALSDVDAALASPHVVDVERR